MAIIVTLIEIFFYTMLFLNVDHDTMWFVIIIPYTLLIIYQAIDIIYWICQPNILIYQYNEGIVIKRNLKIEYKLINKIYCKNYLFKNSRMGNYYRLKCIGTIYIKLKSGKLYKILNAKNPQDAVDYLSTLKRQKKIK